MTRKTLLTRLGVEPLECRLNPVGGLTDPQGQRI